MHISSDGELITPPQGCPPTLAVDTSLLLFLNLPWETLQEKITFTWDSCREGEQLPEVGQRSHRSGGLGLEEPQLQPLPVIETRGVHPEGGNQPRRWQQELSKTSEDEPRALGAAVGVDCDTEHSSPAVRARGLKRWES